MVHSKYMTRHVLKLLWMSVLAVLALLAVVLSPLFSAGASAQVPGFFGSDADKRVPETRAEVRHECAADSCLPMDDADGESLPRMPK